MDPEKTEPILNNSRAYSASFAFIECQVIYFFQLFFRMANPLGILLILRGCRHPSERESLLGVPYFLFFFFL